MEGISGQISLRSQQQFCEQLTAQVLKNETFILLSGDAGSGRTSICEQVVTSCEGKCLAIFIPCQRDLNVQSLRQLLLAQLLPQEHWDLNQSLPDFLAQRTIATRQRILVVVDDADTVVATFFEELLGLFRQQQGQNRFAFIAVGGRLWAENILTSYKSFNFIKECPLPDLQLDEALGLAQLMFKAAGLEVLFNKIRPQLSNKLHSADGNITKVIKLTEKIMAQPSQVKDEFAEDLPHKKKHSSVGIFISLLCLIIVLACLVPLFLGTDFISKYFGGEQPQPQPQDNPTVVTQVNGLEPENPLDNNTVSEPFANPQENLATATTNEPSNDLAPALPAVDASGNANDGTNSSLESIINANNDQGALPENINEGPDVVAPNATTTQSVTLSGQALEAIEGGEAEGNTSEDPRPAVAGSTVDAQQPQPEVDPVSGIKIITRQDNALRIKPVDQPEPQPAQENPSVEQLAQELEPPVQDQPVQVDEPKQEPAAEPVKTAEELQTIAPVNAQVPQQPLVPAILNQEQNNAAVDNAPPVDKAVAVNIAAEAENAAQGAQNNSTTPARANTDVGSIYPDRIVPSGNAVPGSNTELASMQDSHYTLQVVAGSNREAVLEVSAAVSGRYWVYQTTRNNAPWYVLICGDYANADQAAASASSLPNYARRARPFAKSFATVKAEMNR